MKKNSEYFYNYLDSNSHNNLDFEMEENIELVELFKYIVANSSNHIALEYGNKKYTYKELDLITDKLAAYIASLYDEKHTVIGIYLDKSDDFVISLIAILKCGFTFLPLSKKYPPMRLKRMLEIGGASFVITDQEIDLCGLDSVTQIQYDNMPHIIKQSEKKYDLSYKTQAYIIFTSGSTGEPKGIAIRKYSIVNLIYAMQTELQKYTNEDECKVIGVISDFVFDPSIAQIFFALLTGRTLNIIPDEIKKKPDDLINYFWENPINLCEFTPLHLDALFQYSKTKQNRLNLPRFIINCGEALPMELVKKVLLQKEDAIIFNYYGPTEVCVYATVFAITQSSLKNLDKMLIGRPIHNVQVYILDKNMEMCDKEECGEIYIAGNGLAECYVNNPLLTEVSFIKNIFEPFRKMYKTGDLGRWTKDGFIEYLGRKDNQIKIRGYRIEIGEIENIMNQIEAISQCRVVDVKDESSVHLVAYYKAQRVILLEEILEILKQYLPDYMIPSYFVPVTEFPLTSNGKLDKARLPFYKTAFLRDGKGIDIFELDDKDSFFILNICKEVLNVPSLCINDNFVYSGGNSLLVYLLVSRIEELYGINLNVIDILKCNNIGEIVEIVKKKKDRNRQSAGNEKGSKITEVQVTSFQNSILNLERGIAYKRKTNKSTKKVNSNNVINLVTVNKFLNYELFAKAVQCVVSRHEGLRTAFRFDKGCFIAYLNEQTNLEIEYKKCNNVEDINYIKSQAKTFNYDDSKLFQIILFQDDSEQQKILFNFFHPIFDFMSMPILLKDLFAFYDGMELKELDMNYFDFIQRLKEVDSYEGLKFWKEYYKDRPKPLIFKEQLLTSMHVKLDDTFADKEYYLNRALINKIRFLCERNGLTEYDFLICAFGALFAIDNNCNDIILGTYVPGRTVTDSTQMDLIGCFINLIGVRFKLDTQKSYLDYLKEQRQKFINSIAFQYLNFYDISSDIGNDGYIKGDLIKTVFNYVDKQDEEIRFGKWMLKIQEIGDEPEIPYPLTMKAFSNKNDVRICIKYVERLYSGELINKLWMSYTTLMELICKNPEIKVGDLFLKVRF